MKKIVLVILLAISLTLTACNIEEELNCDEGYYDDNGECVEDDTPLVCDEGYHEDNGECVEDDTPLICDVGYHEDNGECVEDDTPLVCDEGYQLVGENCELIYIEDNRFIVYFEIPENWTEVYIYFYSVLPTYSTSWEDAPEMTPVNGLDGWFMYVFPDGTEKATVMFKDSKGNQLPAQNQPGKEINQTTWFYSDIDVNTIVNPFIPAVPTIQVTPSSSEFENEITINVNIISNSQIADMKYLLNGVEYTLNSQATEIVIGNEMEVNDVAELVITVTNAIGTTQTEVYSFTKVEPITYIDLEKIEEYNNLRIYQIYVGAYMDGSEAGYDVGYGPSNHKGDIVGITNSLDYIQSLGMNAIWLTPVFESKEVSSHDQWETRGASTGYFADDYYNIDPNFGTNEEFRTMVEEAHARGIYVFLDGVFGHHGSISIEGVTDGSSQWYGSTIEYPESLEYFKDVATYWIEEYNIDGWRLDQAYQLYQDDYNYLRDIRIAVEELCEERKAAGEEWGTLGYIVGEIWDTSENIDKYAYQNNALRSAFDFPVRYSIVWALAVDRDLNSYHLSYVDTAMNNVYQSYAQPNLFITNHDTLRFGDLVQMAGLEHQYWERHKLAISFLAAYTGPITLYYGDEYGDEFPTLSTNMSDLNQYPYIAPDNVARSEGKISNFTVDQIDLIEYVRTIMELRSEYKALWNGERENLLVTETLYVDLKTSDSESILYIMNIDEEMQNVTLNISEIGGSQVVNLITGDTYDAIDSTITIPVDAITSGFYLIN